MHHPMRAREVLNDCRDVLTDIRQGIRGKEPRRQWITAVVLLCAVGHVLEKVDKPANPSLAPAIDATWSELKRTKPKIFWEFIEKDRNSILKEYEVNAIRTLTVAGGQEDRAQYEYTIRDGHFAGRNHADMLQEAID